MFEEPEVGYIHERRWLLMERKNEKYCQPRRNLSHAEQSGMSRDIASISRRE